MSRRFDGSQKAAVRRLDLVSLQELPNLFGRKINGDESAVAAKAKSVEVEICSRFDSEFHVRRFDSEIGEMVDCKIKELVAESIAGTGAIFELVWPESSVALRIDVKSKDSR